MAIRLQDPVLFSSPEITSLDKLRDILEIIVSVQKESVTAGRLTSSDAGKGLHSELSEAENRAAGRTATGGRSKFCMQELEWEEEDEPPCASECAFVSELS